MESRFLFLTLQAATVSLLLLHVHHADAGAIYTRWGRGACPEGASLVYRGSVAGTHYTESGGGSNFLCMQNDPVNGPAMSKNLEMSATLYGAEYQPSYFNLFSKENNGGVDLLDYDAVCAICHVDGSSTMMVPGTDKCVQDTTPAWKLEYNGYLMAQRKAITRTEFICVDGAPEGRSGSAANVDGVLLSFVAARGGKSLPAEYLDNRAVQCAVCSTEPDPS